VSEETRWYRDITCVQLRSVAGYSRGHGVQVPLISEARNSALPSKTSEDNCERAERDRRHSAGTLTGCCCTRMRMRDIAVYGRSCGVSMLFVCKLLSSMNRLLRKLYVLLALQSKGKGRPVTCQWGHRGEVEAYLWFFFNSGAVWEWWPG
jgi:hypothetical protein